ncbi:laminin-like protein epi-1 isoform X2 [Bolinopsis microptera]|uniref:laminin-like protein epi-1 isoform X2 n=1 Tax=Bolinopsis microptera TaxID=2820187 RepID=UPI00307AC729
MWSLLFLLAFLSTGATYDCDCELSGTIGALSTCNTVNRGSPSCNCRPSVIAQTNCDACYPQFYNLSSINVYGCQRCSCDLGGSLSPVCDYMTGQCRCREGITGRDCDRPNTGTYVPALYHIKSNLVIEDSISGLNLESEEGPAEINGVIEPHNIADVPPRFELLFNEYPVPISFEEIEGVSQNMARRRKAKNMGKKRKLRSVPEMEPIIKEMSHHVMKRQTQDQVMFATEIEFAHPGIYFLVLNYTATENSSVSVFVGDIAVPTMLPECERCLIMLAGSLGVKGIDVSRSGKQLIKVSTPSSVQIHYTIALPKEYYFTSSLKQDVSPRCFPGPFTQLCNRYRYPIEASFHLVEEAEAWLNPVFQPAYTKLVGVNLFGRLNNVDSNGNGKATNKMRVDLQLQPGVYYYLIVKYYKPNHYINYDDSFTGALTLGDETGEIEFIPCPWEEGCRAVATNKNKKLKLFYSVVDPTATLTLKLEEDSMVFIDSIMLIREEDWNLDLVQAQFYCIQGPDNECLKSDFIDLRDYVMYESESAIDAVKIELQETFYHGTGVMLLDQSSPSLSVIILENTITRTEPEQYVVIVHYFKYTSDVARGFVNIQDENNSGGDVLYKFCPSASGCRVAATISGRIESGVVSHNPSWTGYWTPLPVSGGNTIIIVTLSLTHAESVFVDYLSLVPLKDFTADMLHPLPLDHGPLFTQYCAYHYLYMNPEPQLEAYCKKISFSMTTMYNNGTLECDCSGAGSLSDTCDQITGQCQCKPGFAGRICDQCAASHYGYPACTSCDCDPENSYSDTCDQETGQCECEHNFKGLTCTECADSYYGYLNDRLTCDIPCECDVQGSTQLGCHHETGLCSCNERATGDKCDSCPPGHYRFPACYSCDCSDTGSLGSECDVTGTCDCKEGYSGARCEECAETHHYNGTDCVPCHCSGVDAICSEVKFYPHQELEDFTHGVSDYSLVDSTGAQSPAGRLTTIQYEGDSHVLMVDLTHGDEYTYLVLPSRFVGDKRSSENQLFSYDVDLTVGGNAEIVSETFFKGQNNMTISYRYAVNHTSNKPKRVKVEVPLNLDIPLHSTSQWRLEGEDTQPSNEEIQNILRNLTEIRINTKMFDRQLVAMIDNIELGYLSATPTSAEPHYYPVCECGRGYTGEQCEQCATGFSRSPETGLCDRPCQCNGNSELCDEQGICLDCENNSTGDQCEVCVAGYYYSSVTEQCEPCACSGNGQTSSSQSCEEVEGEKVCSICEVGYTGISCEQCDNGYHGDPESNTGCTQCPCNDNLNLTQSDACDSDTGRCNICKDSTDGRFCEECADNYYGDARNNGTCTPCECFMEGSLSEQCDQSGSCRCKGGIGGDKCDQCNAGRYVSRGKCRPCGCFVLSSTSQECDTRTGQCDCVTGYGGRTCEECDVGYYERFGNCLECGCSETGSEGPACDEDGMCTCKDGYYGDKCMECSEAHVVNEDGSCSVCGDCPLKLLERLIDVNNTLDAGKTSALMSDFAQKMDSIKDRAKDVEDAIPVPENLEDLLAELDAAQKAEKDNEKRADALTPRSQEAYADAGDTKRATRDVPDEMGALEDELKDLIDNLDNFNVSPDVVDSGQAIAEAEEAIQEIEKWDPEPKHKEAENAKDKAKTINDEVTVAVPANLTIPTLDPLPERVEFIEDEIEDVVLDLANQTQAVDLIELKVGGIEMLEKAAKDIEDDVEELIANSTAEVPVIEENNNATEQGLDEIEMLDLVPLQELVEGQQEALTELTPLVKPKEFNCSGLQDIRNVSSDDPGPALVKEMVQTEKDLEELRRRVAAAEEAAANATEKVDEFGSGVQDKELALSDLDIRKADVEPKLNDIISGEPVQRDAIGDLDAANEADKERLQGVIFPQIPGWDVEEPPEPNTDMVNPDPLQTRIDDIEKPPELYGVSDELPGLINDTETADGQKRIVIEKSREIDYKLRSLWDKIEKAKRSVETILIPMRFTGEESYARYSATLERTAYLSVKATIKPEEDDASGGIVYIGPPDNNARRKRQAIGADYIEMGLFNGNVVCNMNIDNSETYLIQDNLIVPKDSWTKVHLQRIGGYIQLSVNDTIISNEEPSTTSSFNAVNIEVGKSNQGSLKGSITDVMINGERISQWLTEDKMGVNKSVWADRMISDDKDIYYFNGDNSYLAFQTMRGQNPYLRTTSLNVKTASEEGLIMFYAEGSEYEGNQEVFAMDLFEGSMRLHYTNADGGLDSVAVTPDGDDNFADMLSRELSAYVQRRNPGTGFAQMQVKSPQGTSREKVEASLKFERHRSPSKTYFGMVPNKVMSRFPSVFEEGGITQVPFTGCMSPKRINNVVLRQSNVATARNVKNGCPDKMVRSLSLKNEGAVKLSHAAMGPISFVMATVARSGNILYIGNSESDYLLVSVEEGKLAIKLVLSGTPFILKSNAMIDTGSKRFIRILISTDSVSLFVDDTKEAGSILGESQVFEVDSGKALYLGLLPAELGIRGYGYTGCISDLVIKDKIFNFAYDAVAKTNVIFDRCRTIKSLAADGPTDMPVTAGASTMTPEFEIANLESLKCVSYQTNTAPDSFLVSSEGGVMNFLKIDNIRSNSIYIRFVLEFSVSTVSSSGVLFFARSANGKEIILKFNDEKVTLSITMGGKPMELTWEGSINDGVPHRVKFSRIAYNVELIVDKSKDSGVMERSGRTSHGFALVSEDELDSCSNGICIGGAPPSVNQDESLGFNMEFVGCISGIMLDRTTYDSSTITTVGNVPQCTEGGAMSSAHFFNGDSSLIPDVDISTDTMLLLTFKSSRQTGTLMTLLDSQDSVVLQISLDNYRMLISAGGGEPEELFPVEGATSFYFCDGAPHHLTVMLNSGSASVTVDDNESEVTVKLTSDPVSLRLGDQFLGCLEDPILNGIPVSLTNPRVNSGVRLESCPNVTF